MSSTKNVVERVEKIRREVATDPSVGLPYLDELNRWLVHENSQVRFGGLDILIKLSENYPHRLRDYVPGVISRLDDESTSVRAAALTVQYNLARWYPQAFGHTTEHLLSIAKDATEKKERAAAVGTLARMAVMMPDIVTPRVEIRQSLISFTDLDDAEAILDSCSVSLTLVETAIDVLAGGDMASRPVEEDLAPTPRNAKLSKPAQVGFRGVFWGLTAPFFFLIGVITASRFAWRFRHLTPMGRLRALLGELRKAKFFKNTHRRALYLRSSMWPTSIQLFRFLPGKTPVSENLNGEHRPLPDDWGIRASLVRRRDRFRCRNCGAGGGPNGDAELHVDHRVPRSAGGDNSPENLRTLCRECHEARHARVFDV